jgi:hypothetical protein
MCRQRVGRSDVLVDGAEAVLAETVSHDYFPAGLRFSLFIGRARTWTELIHQFDVGSRARQCADGQTVPIRPARIAETIVSHACGWSRYGA